jgi:hypothetical protein
MRAVIGFRVAEPAIRHGSTASIGADGPAMALERRLDDARLILALNPGESEMLLDVAIEGVASGRLEPVELPGVDAGGAVDVSDGRARIPLLARAGRVMRVAGSEA